MFYKLDDKGNLLAGNRIFGPGLSLLEEQKDEYTYPIEGWWWFDTEEEALRHFGLDVPIVVTNANSVTRFQARAALLQAGLLEQVDAWVEQNADPIAKLAWKEGLTFERDDPLLTQLATAFGMSDEQLDQLFESAKQIRTR